MSGIFYCGDNLEILTELNLIPAESVDLIYLDPPFNSQRTYNIVYKGSLAQAAAFKDYWEWSEVAASYARLIDSASTPPKLKTLLRGLHDLLIEDDADLLAYLVMMAPRLFALHRVLKPTGSLYLHCDPTASHYLKMLLDAVFGISNFRNEVIWTRTVPKSDFRQGALNWPRVHDVALYYARKHEESGFTQALAPLSDEYVNSHYSLRDPDGRRYQLTSLNAPGGGTRGHPKYELMGVTRYWRYNKEKMMALVAAGRVVQPSPGAVPRYKRYLDESSGVPIGDVWSDIAPINSQAEERTPYPTQKPLALLQRIIEASSKPGDLVLDPFCGCGTTIEACEKLGRRWIGIDIAAKAVDVTGDRFKRHGWDPPEVRWYPPDMDAAKALAASKNGGKAFETWALRKVRAARISKRDRGIDGEAHFSDHGKLTRVLVSVKSGKLKPSDLRDLRGTLERERAPIGVLVTLNEPSKEMRLEATRAGFLQHAGRSIPRLQLLTVERIFAGERIDAPGENVTVLDPGIVPLLTPEHEQLSLRLEPPKPTTKVRKPREDAAAASTASRVRASKKSEPPTSSRRAGRQG